MNDLEERIRAMLADRAVAPAIRTMPPGTRGRIRSRQAGSALVALAAAMAFSFVTFQLFSTPSGRSRTADGEGEAKVQVVQPPDGLDATLDLHDVDAPAPGEWPAVTRGDLSGAYVDHSVEDEASVVVDKTPIDAGRVQDEPWSLGALEQNGEGLLWSEASPGPCGELYLGSWGADGGASFCLRLDDMEGSPEMTSMGIVWGVGPITAYAGVATGAVDRIELELEGGGSREVPLLDGPPAVSGRYFAVFVPNGARGRLVAYGPSGEVVVHHVLCAAELEVPPDAAAGCGNGLLSTSSPVVSGP
jgi:hypothetical protein